MKPTLVVSDTSPIRALAHLQLLGAIAQLFDRVLVPPAVADELIHPRRSFRPVHLDEWPVIAVRAPADQQAISRLEEKLDRGESEAIALAVEVGADLLVDESAARREARGLGLQTTGVAGVLIRAKQLGVIDAVLPLIDRLQQELGFFVSVAFRAQVARAAGETE